MAASPMYNPSACAECGRIFTDPENNISIYDTSECMDCVAKNRGQDWINAHCGPNTTYMYATN